MKFLRIVFTIIGILAILLGLLMLTSDSGLALTFGFLGLFIIILSRLIKKKPKTAETVAVETISAEPQQSLLQKTIKVAGISNYMEAVMDFAIENDEFEYTKKQIKEEDLEDEEIPEYTFRGQHASFKFEPDNKYDKEAIAIYVKSSKIGYVPKDRIAFIRDIINSDRLKNATCEFVGGNYKIYDSGEDRLKTVELNIGARITVEYTE